MESGGGSRRPETSAAMSVAAVSVRGPISLSLSLPLPPGDVRRNVRCRCVCSTPDCTLSPPLLAPLSLPLPETAPFLPFSSPSLPAPARDCTLSSLSSRSLPAPSLSFLLPPANAVFCPSLLFSLLSLPPFLPLSLLSPAPSLSFLLPPANAVFCPPLLSPPSI